MAKLQRIPRITVAVPKTRPMRTTPAGVVWNPRQTTKDANVQLIFNRNYNRITAGMSILNQGALCDETE